MKLPSFQFYPGDWRKDPDLARATHEEKGVWMDMLCLMFECKERGILATAGVAWTDEDIAFAVGGDQPRTLLCVRELVRKGVAKRNQAGAIYSARLVADEQKRKACSEAGKKGGGNPDFKGGDKGGSKGPAKGETKASSSSSPSSSASKPKATDSGPGKPAPDPRIALLQKSFYEALKAQLKEEPAKYNGGMAGSGFKTLLQKYSVEEITARFDAWFKSTDQFIVDNSFKVEMFFGSFNRLKDGPILKRSANGQQRPDDRRGGVPESKRAVAGKYTGISN